MRNVILLLLMLALVVSQFVVKAKCLDTGQVVKEKVASVRPTTTIPTEFAVIDGTEVPIRPVTLLAEYVRPECPTYKTQFNKALEAKPVKSDYGI